MTYDIDLSGQVGLITGAGHGVGRSTALAFSLAGAHVLVNDFDPALAEAVAGEITDAGGQATPIPFDVSDYVAVRAAIDAAPGVDILVNNAGNAGPPVAGVSVSVGRFVETEPEEWDRYFAVNLFGVMNCTRAVLPHMLETSSGRVITLVSEAGRVGEPRMAPYAAAKAGAAGFMRAIAKEVGASGITANCVSLGTVDTIGLAKMAEESEEWAERLAKQKKAYITRRLGTPDDVAGVITFLASGRGSWITGQTYPVNGGYTVNQ